MRRPFGWDLPPGVNVSDIPGNRPEDAAWEIILDKLGEHLKTDEARGALVKLAYQSVHGLELVEQLIQYGIDLGKLDQMQVEQESAFYHSVFRNEGITKLLDLLREDFESGPVRVYPIPELVAKVNKLGEELLGLLEKIDRGEYGDVP